VGDRQAAARNTLQDAGFKVSVWEVPVGDPGDVDVVFSTNPAAGTQAAAGSQVTLTVGVES
jgi:beta-lactam-binding protein with PASTA domain